MKLFVLPSLVLGTLLLTSCTNNRVIEVIPHKTFQYSYQGPSRVLSDASFSKHLSSGKSGSNVKVILNDNLATSARLGHNYYSASGYTCRRYTILPSYEHTACNINGRWYQASPIIISKQN